MASYAPLHHAIWENDDFRALTPEAKLLYLLLISHRKLSRCGVLDLMPSRWLKATGLRDVQVPLAELVRRRFVLVDDGTEELAVRTKVKSDEPGTWTQVKAVWKAWEQVESAWLRSELVWDFPDSVWGDEKAPAPCDRPSGERPGTPSHTPWDAPTDGVGRVIAPSTLHLHPAPCPVESFVGDNKTGDSDGSGFSTGIRASRSALRGESA